MSPKIAVLGAGAFGIALAKVLSENKNPVCLWTRQEVIAEHIIANRCHPSKLAGILLPASVHATTNLKEAVGTADVIIFALPMIAFREAINQCKEVLPNKVILVNTTKGIEQETGLFSEQIVAEILGPAYANNYVFLSGPSFAFEIGQKLPTTLIVAGSDMTNVELVKKCFANDYIHIKTSSDLIGLEACSALKNIVAIAAGIFDGLKLGQNAKAALITNGLAEIAKVVICLNGKQDTVYGVSGIGDLILTCYGNLSRNRFVGQELANGRSLVDILSSMKEVPEGVQTTKAAQLLIKKFSINAPILTGISTLLLNKEKATVNSVMQMQY